MLEQFQFLLQCGFLSGFQPQVLHILHQLSQILPAVRLLLFQLSQVVQALRRLLQCTKALLIPVQPCVISAKSVQNLQMAFRREQHLIVMLSVDVDQRAADLPQHGNRSGMSIDPCCTSAVRCDLPCQQQLVVLVGDGKRIQLGADRRRELGKQRRNDRFFATGPHNVSGHTLPQYGMNAMDQDGFSGTGLPGEHVQMGRKRNTGVGDDCQIFDFQFC